MNVYEFISTKCTSYIAAEDEFEARAYHHINRLGTIKAYHLIEPENYQYYMFKIIDKYSNEDSYTHGKITGIPLLKLMRHITTTQIIDKN